MKFFNKNKKYFAFPVVLTGAGSVMAAMDTTTFDSLVNEVDFSIVTTAVVTVAGALALVYIAWKGAKMILAAVKGG